MGLSFASKLGLHPLVLVIYQNRHLWSHQLAGIWLKLVNEHPKFGLDNIEERVRWKQDQLEVVTLVHNTSMKDRTKVYSNCVLPSYFCEATSCWHLAN
jgi:hypothetical protein